jgi:hypothetical protein
MEKILNILSREIGGNCYKSLSYCHDHISVDNNYDSDLRINYADKNQGETDYFVEPKDLKKNMDEIIKHGTKPLFRYFLDGSRKTYKVDDIVFNDDLYPIIAGQIGVGCCERVFVQGKQVQFKPVRLKQYFLLSLPENADKDGKNNFFKELSKIINEADSIKKRNIFIDEVKPYSTRKLNEGELYENRGIIIIQNKMIELEKVLVDELVRDNLLNHDAYLLKDGSLEYSEKGREDKGHSLSILRNNYSRVIGVSKSFNPYLARDKRNKSIANVIANLPSFHRTPVYRYKPSTINAEFGVWYVRINKKENMFNPLDGILKVEKILTRDNEIEYGLNSDEVDNITTHLINERSPSCYGVDKRWASHLYPVYLTEKYIKSKYLSDAYFLNLF